MRAGEDTHVLSTCTRVILPASRLRASAAEAAPANVEMSADGAFAHDAECNGDAQTHAYGSVCFSGRQPRGCQYQTGASQHQHGLAASLALMPYSSISRPAVSVDLLHTCPSLTPPTPPRILGRALQNLAQAHSHLPNAAVHVPLPRGDGAELLHSELEDPALLLLALDLGAHEAQLALAGDGLCLDLLEDLGSALRGGSCRSRLEAGDERRGKERPGRPDEVGRGMGMGSLSVSAPAQHAPFAVCRRRGWTWCFEVRVVEG